MAKQPPNPTKYCAGCDKEKPREDFYKRASRPDGLQSWCKECQLIVARDGHLKRKYGMTLADYDRMLDEQGGGCAICGTTEPGCRYNTFHVDHDHATGEVRGLLCAKCNPGLGNFNDDPDLLQNAIDYLNWHKELGKAA